MALQSRLLLLPPDAQRVSEHLAMQRQSGQMTLFDASGPIFTCKEDDIGSIRVAAAILTEPRVGLAKPSEMGRALGWDRTRVFEYRRRLSEGGAEAVQPRRTGPRGPHKLKGITLARAQKYLNQGESIRGVARRVGLSHTAIQTALKDGRLIRQQQQRASEATVPETASAPRARSDEDACCVAGVAVKRQVDRALARVGKLAEAVPQFEPAESVAKAGVLVALPALLGQGLIDVGQQTYGSLKNGYYGLKSMLLTFGLMALIRIKSIEGLTNQAPGEFGLVLGLDRAPEMKTARRKLAELGCHGRALEFSRAFTERWAQEQPDALGYLYVDGHVRPYHGRKYKLPKTHVQRRRLCMPATTDYWVNDANAEPLLFVTAPANDGLLSMMDKQLLPEIRRLVGEERRVTLIFDREGWSPRRFKKWKQSGIDVITYRKGKYRDWQHRCFEEVTTTVCGRKVKYLLAERTVPLGKRFRIREVRRLCEDGHQTAVVTTRRDIPIEEVAVRMFSRWQQENFFRYMRHEFALDHLPTTAVEPADPERSVPNPAVKAKKRELGKVKARLTKAEQTYGQKVHDNPQQKCRTVADFKVSHAELGREIKQLRATQERLAAEVKALPARVPVREVMNGEPVVQLERERKIITDTLKMVAYRAETQLANLVGPLLPYRDDEARKFMRQVFELPADLVPDYEQGKLVVQLHGMATPRSNRALAALCAALNDLKCRYPGTDLRLVLEAPPIASESR